MAQKINPVNLRLNKRSNWNFKLCTHDFKDYSNLVANSRYIKQTNNKILTGLNVTKNPVTIVKTTKTYKSNIDYLDFRYFYYCLQMLAESNKNIPVFIKLKSEYIQIFRQMFKLIILNQKQLIQVPSKLEANKKYKPNKIAGLNSVSLMPEIATELTKNLIARFGHNQKNASIKTFFAKNYGANITRNITRLIDFYLFEFKHKILGIKIICSGKWKKTKTGRKQKMYLKFGKIQNSNIANKMTHNVITETTKFGVVSIKIWVLQKNN